MHSYIYASSIVESKYYYIINSLFFLLFLKGKALPFLEYFFLTFIASLKPLTFILDWRMGRGWV